MSACFEMIILPAQIIGKLPIAYTPATILTNSTHRIPGQSLLPISRTGFGEHVLYCTACLIPLCLY